MELKIPNYISDSVNNLGIMSWYQGDMTQTLAYLVEALKYREIAGNLGLRALILLNLVQK